MSQLLSRLTLAATLTGALSLALPARAAHAIPKPAPLRFEIRSAVWAQGFPDSTHKKVEVTTVYDASRGDDIDGGRVYGTRWAFPKGAPFRMGERVDSTTAWVSFDPALVPGPWSADGSEPNVTRSILVSSTWRTFHSRTTDTGIEFSIRTIPARAPSPLELPSGMQAMVGKPARPGLEDLCDRVTGAEAIGVFKVIATRPGPDLEPELGSPSPTTELDVIPRELWRAGPLSATSTIKVLQQAPVTGDSNWTLPNHPDPLRTGEEAVLFLLRGDRGQLDGRWMFTKYGGYAVLEANGTRVSSHYGRDVPIERFHDAVNVCMNFQFGKGKGVVMGRVLSAGSGRPIAGAGMWIHGARMTTRTGADGSFLLSHVPIGRRTILVTDSLGKVWTPVDVTDEQVAEVELHVALPNDPVPPSPVVAAVAPRQGRRWIEGWNEYRPRLTAAEEAELRRVDVAPSAYVQRPPEFESGSRMAGSHGGVAATVSVDSQGVVNHVRCAGMCSGETEEWVSQCLKTWRFRPGLKDGRPTDAWTTVEIRF